MGKGSAKAKEDPEEDQGSVLDKLKAHFKGRTSAQSVADFAMGATLGNAPHLRAAAICLTHIIPSHDHVLMSLIVVCFASPVMHRGRHLWPCAHC